MDIRLKKEEDVLNFFKIKEIEGIKTSSKTIKFLITLYEENIRLKQELDIYKPI